MKDNQIASTVVRLLSGCSRFRYKKHIFLFYPPTLDLLSRAEFYWQELFDEVKFNGWPTMSTINNVRIELGIWSDKEEEQLIFAEKQVDEIKQKMYINYMADLDISRDRFLLNKIKNQYYILLNKKHSIDYTTVEGYADSVKNELVLRECISFEEDFIPTSRQWSDILSIVKNSALTHTEYRCVARSNLWHSYWYNGSSKIFLQKPHEMNYEQRNICSISRMYDNAKKASDPPSEDIINDDDLFDGWLLYKKNKDDSDTSKQKIDKIVDKHHRGASHVFVVADQSRTPEQINKMNRNPNNVKKMANIGK